MTPSAPTHEDFLREAIDLAVTSVQVGGGPFGAVIVRDGGIIARGENRVTSSHDPTAHAEIVAIRTACSQLANHSLAGCTLYASCEPCPMCLGAVLWSRLGAVYYAASQDDAAAAGFDDARFYEALQRNSDGFGIPYRQLVSEAATQPFTAWKNKHDRVEY
ncbi:Guanine deaminase [Maioricimonas rarisocia]|uniref:Guanine deaminase n=1 Tax=Maioricimonas rarisocia TaxID=2528026 RepID=A0A517Z443_9PLAN|nr:nucleoside deaminase [Maioricimonas rarisocia]QDU37268.1 Guanine deaminase [Maioricimonas rarisocia]